MGYNFRSRSSGSGDSQEQRLDFSLKVQYVISDDKTQKCLGTYNNDIIQKT